MTQVKKPQAKTSQVEKELDKAQQQFEAFDKQVKDLTLDRMNETKKEEVEPQTKLSSKEIEDSSKIWLKPKRSIGSRDKFNEKFREELNFQKEYVQFIAENKEIVGEAIEIWTRPFGGMSAEYWEVPVNKPVWGPRYLAEQIKRKYYHRLKTEDKVTSNSSMGQMYGQMVVDTTVQRLDAVPVSSRKSIFMGTNNFN